MALIPFMRQVKEADMAELGRLLTAMVTPFDDKGAVDFEQA